LFSGGDERSEPENQISTFPPAPLSSSWLAAPADATILWNPSGFGLSRYYPAGSHPTAFAGGSATRNSFSETSAFHCRGFHLTRGSSGEAGSGG